MILTESRAHWNWLKKKERSNLVWKRAKANQREKRKVGRAMLRGSWIRSLQVWKKKEKLAKKEK